MDKYVIDNEITCPDCGAKNFTPIRSFELMLKTNLGVVEDDTTKVYLRPETAQGIFINYKNVLRTSRQKVPFGIGQIGKSFRNEITPGNFIFRTREFEQMELEFFAKPGTELEYFDYYENKVVNFLTDLGLKNFRVRAHEETELSHYSNKTSDIEFLYPFGWSELWGIASRTDFDLKAHQTASKVDMAYLDPTTNEKYVPYVIEPAVGVDRLFLAFLSEAYEVEQLEDDEREVLRLDPRLAPVKVAILPLVKKLAPNCDDIYTQLSKKFICEYDESGKIGKRYRRQDVIGTPLCVTYDYDSLEDNCVTVRHRDSMKQDRVAINDLVTYVENIVGM
jgi:glycyl-tRNA synthetase